MTTPRRRLPAAERRESILEAAAQVFGERGYAAATTDAIAHIAGISQAYVVRTFGSKEALFIATAERAVDSVIRAFQNVVDESPDREGIEMRLGAAYVRLAEDRGVLVTLLQLFTLGSDPVVGRVARDCFMRIYAVVREGAGLSAQRTSDFLAKGMLVSTLLGLQLPIVCDQAPVAELLATTFQENTDLVLNLYSQ